MVKITFTAENSIAEKMKIQPLDVLVSVNGHEIHDVLDYRFYLTETDVELELLRDGQTYFVKIKKGEYEDIGLDFETPLMDKKHRCENGCIFCFIDQLPRGLRDSLYFKDDDSRLSFLHGNYITMTNLTDRDIDRIIEMHISPVNISVHATEPELRCMMMKNKRAGDTLGHMKKLAAAGCELHCQIVLCKGINDGAHLTVTMRELAQLYPAMQSTSIVPAGLTAYRGNLYKLDPFTNEDCADVIAQVTAFSAECNEKFGQNLFFCSDEFYVGGGIPRPSDEYYEEYTQIENGVGMLTSFEKSFCRELDALSDDEKKIVRDVTIATGEASYEFICELVEKIKKVCYNVKCNVYMIKNNFFGGHITVTGLLTGVDICAQLSGKRLGGEVLLSRSVLRSEGDLFLCGMSLGELSDSLGVDVKTVENDGADFLLAVLGVI